MLRVTIPDIEQWDEANQEFINVKGTTLQLEHSLVSLSKWESKWCKPFLTKDIKTEEETIDYIKCMTITQNVNPNVYTFMPSNIREEIKSYIDAPMTATWFNDKNGKANSEQITSELIYYWMISLQIPFECEKCKHKEIISMSITEYSSSNHFCPSCGEEIVREVKSLVCAMSVDRTGDFYQKVTF